MFYLILKTIKANFNYHVKHEDQNNVNINVSQVKIVMPACKVFGKKRP